MRIESMSNMRPNRTGKTIRGVSLAWAAVSMLLLPPTAARAAGPGGAGPAVKNSAVSFENIPGSTVKRIILSAKAAERLGLETGMVGEEIIVRKQMVSGLVAPPVEARPMRKPAGGVFGGMVRRWAPQESKPKDVGFGDIGRVKPALATQSVAAAEPEPQPGTEWATSTPAGDVWVLVTLSPAEWARLAKDKPARILPLATRDKFESEIWAQPSGMEPLEDMKRLMLSLYYVVTGRNRDLTLKHRVRVELQLSGSDEMRKVVPYGAVYYDAQGAAWVYVNTKPLTFERQRVDIERVVGDWAVLSTGPPVGTPVVTVGAALLYGAEIFGK